ncbi:MAG: ABC transporter permease [Clostridiales bacterium]|nr:ABC transporter permease [Clostridiales bacterium]
MEQQKTEKKRSRSRKGYVKYFRKKLIWFVLTLIIAVALNFILPRLMPGDPVQAMTGKLVAGTTSNTIAKEMYERYAEEFGTNKPLFQQFFIYVGNVMKGNFGLSFSEYPRPVSDVVNSAVWWTVCLQIPAIIFSWIIGNLLGAVAAYRKKVWDKAVMPFTLFLSAIPAFAMAVILFVIFAVTLKWAPISGGYAYDMIPPAINSFGDFFAKFPQIMKLIGSVLEHYQLPFWSIVLISIGGQAVGMRSMSIYELNADYVKYSRFMGIKDRKIVRYVFRNAMLPQVTGLTMSIGTSVGGSLVAETIFSYPGLGSAMLKAVTSSDYPVISATTLIITIMVLICSLMLDVIYAVIDPRVKAAQFD